MTYKISRRIEAEERALENAMMVFTSTQQEVDEQWGLYDSYAFPPGQAVQDMLQTAASVFQPAFCSGFIAAHRPLEGLHATASQ